MRRHPNFLNSEMHWTIDQIHSLWVRACERADKQYKAKSDFLREIVETFPKDDRGHTIVYFYHRNDASETVHQYSIRYERDCKCYSYSQDRAPLKTRDDKLTFLLSTEKEFEAGQKLHELDHLCSDLQYTVRHYLWTIIEGKLQEKFKNYEGRVPDVFILDIGDRKYFVTLDDQHRHGYLKFHLKNEVSGETFTL